MTIMFDKNILIFWGNFSRDIEGYEGFFNWSIALKSEEMSSFLILEEIIVVL